MKKIETDSLDPVIMKTKDKIKKLVERLIKERGYIYEQITMHCESGARLMIDTIADVGRATSGIQRPMWGSWGPMQGNYGAKVDSLAGQLRQIEQTLEMIYELWPKLNPNPLPKKDEPEPAQPSDDRSLQAWHDTITTARQSIKAEKRKKAKK